VVDWKQLKAEYVAGGTSYRKLAEKYDVPRSNIERRAKAEKWSDLRRQAEDKATAKIVDTISNNSAKKADKIVDAADKLLKKIAELAEIVGDSQSIKQLSSALKDIKDIKGFKTDADMREQEARIRNLEKQAEADNNDNEIKVTISSDIEEYSR
jgi:hypothetical protein